MISIDLTGHLALVTGATGELGRTMVRALAEAGADVIIHYHKSLKIADSLAAEIEAGGRRAVTAQCDVGHEESVRAMAEDLRARVGAPDIVVANAVVQYQWTSVLNQAPADYESQFRSCVLHVVHLARTFAPAMIEKGWGRFIGINTECAMQNWENQSAYVSGKRGMDGVLRVLAKEIGRHGVTVNQVAPGWTVSENRPDSEGAAWYREQVPLARRGTDREIAGVVAFLASDLSSFVTGAYVPVCGGNVMPAI